MNYDPSYSSGTDDDLQPSHQNTGIRGGLIAGNGGTAVCAPYSRVQNDMESQIHRFEQEAYSSVLRAFKAQSDAITWEKESLITELRKELRVTNDEHRELLSRVNADEMIQKIREWRQEGGLHSGVLNSSQLVHDPVPSPTVSASRKRKKMSLLGAPSPALNSQGLATSMQPSLTTGKLGVASGAKGQILPCVSSMKSLQYPSTGPSGRDQFTNRTGALRTTEPAEGAAFDPLIGRKVMTRWPEDNNFYEAVITDYNAREGLHALVYDISTINETWEWVNLKEISPEDIRWVAEDPDITHQTADGGGPVRGVSNSIRRGGAVPPGAGRGRGSAMGRPNTDFVPSQNCNGTNGSDAIKILDMETLMKEAEHILGASHPDPFEIAKIKKMLKEHEQSLIDAISRLAYVSDGESEGGEHRFSNGQLMEREQRWSNRECALNQQGDN